MNYRVDVNEHAIAEMLIATERLTEAEALCRAMVEQALSEIVADLIVRWEAGRNA